VLVRRWKLETQKAEIEYQRTRMEKRKRVGMKIKK